ncbi:MAG TPA: DUF2892 domain-containing protein [Chitinophagaceae bacterium]|nr:DUF2892 domain-containing protein [Chitinophagaceae bacterium]
MKLNMGRADRFIRLIIAVAIFILWYQKIITGTAGIVLLVIGGIFVLTSMVGVCPLYSILGISTCSRKKVI